ncbi:hypothetical protein [Parvimonas sp. G1425]
MENKPFKLLIILFLFFVSINLYSQFKVVLDEGISKKESVILEK